MQPLFVTLACQTSFDPTPALPQLSLSRDDQREAKARGALALQPGPNGFCCFEFLSNFHLASKLCPDEGNDFQQQSATLSMLRFILK